MAKDQSFASKFSRSDLHTNCDVCGEKIVYLKVVNSEVNPETDSYKFNANMVGICKCNESKVKA